MDKGNCCRKEANPAPRSDAGERGRAFASFTKWLTEKREQLRQIDDRNRQQAAELIALDKCIDVLKTVAVNGLVTSYGIDFVAAFAGEMFKDAKPAATLAAYNL